MKKQLSLVELAVYGYDPTRVKKGSLLEKQFKPKDEEVRDNERIGRSDQDQEQQTGQ